MSSNNDVAGQVGQLIGNRYQLVQPAGRGGMGTVWRAEDVTLGAPVAIKLVSPTLLDPANADVSQILRRFLREARAAAALRSPHVVQILDYGVDVGVPFMVLELLDGESLDRRLERTRVLSGLETVRVITHVARALTRAREAGIIHRDLKPSNVFLIQNDDEEIAKVLDFGLAKRFRAPLASHQSELTGTGLVLGTPAYMSPEQAQGNPVDFRTDLWALAIIAFECLCGKLPFDDQIVAQLLLQICVAPLPIPSEHASVPRGFDAWFAKAASRDPAHRFESAKEMADALRAALIPDAIASDAAPLVIAARTGPVPEDERPTRVSDRPPLPSAVTDNATTRIVARRARIPPAAADETGEKTGVVVSSDITPLGRSSRAALRGAVALIAAAGLVGLLLHSRTWSRAAEPPIQGSAGLIAAAATPLAAALPLDAPREEPAAPRAAETAAAITPATAAATTSPKDASTSKAKARPPSRPRAAPAPRPTGKKKDPRLGF